MPGPEGALATRRQTACRDVSRPVSRASLRRKAPAGFHLRRIFPASGTGGVAGARGVRRALPPARPAAQGPVRIADGHRRRALAPTVRTGSDKRLWGRCFAERPTTRVSAIAEGAVD